MSLGLEISRCWWWPTQQTAEEPLSIYSPKRTTPVVRHIHKLLYYPTQAQTPHIKLVEYAFLHIQVCMPVLLQLV